MTQNDEPTTNQKVEKTDAEWRARLTPEQFRIARQQGTERAFTGAYWDHHDKGVYRCVCCGAPVFDSAQQIRFRHGLAELLAAGRSPDGRDPGGPQPVHDPHGGSLRARPSRHIFPDGRTHPGYCIDSAARQLQAEKAVKVEWSSTIADIHAARSGRARRRPRCRDPPISIEGFDACPKPTSRIGTIPKALQQPVLEDRHARPQ
jgi:peptide-methionine (R)-S-oxide reductase